jgi:hypothetical protein
MTPSLHAQATAVARAAANHRGHVENLSRLVGARKRPEHEFIEAKRWLPDLEAAAKTISELANQSPQTPAGRPNAPPPV